MALTKGHQQSCETTLPQVQLNCLQIQPAARTERGGRTDKETDWSLRSPRKLPQMLETIPHMSLLQRNASLPQLAISHPETSAIWQTSFSCHIKSKTHFLKIALEVEIVRLSVSMRDSPSSLQHLLTHSQKSSTCDFPCSFYICFLSKSLELSFAPLVLGAYQPQPQRAI